jgi:murein DD-endopeptidase MepM/ murein hydrolase activator NlpD
MAGSPEAAPEVEIPFACGRTFTVSQAHDTGSHLNNDTWAWDIRMPEGVPITAALDGVVRLARGDSTTGGCGIEYAKDANYVVVNHPGGLETQYLHFVKVVVKAGEVVKKGQLLGYSGKTGWACGSHLHFKVARTEGNGWNNPSVPAKVARYGDPQTGTELTSIECNDQQPYIASFDQPEPVTPAGVAQLIQRVEKAQGAAAPPDQSANGDTVVSNK